MKKPNCILPTFFLFVSIAGNAQQADLDSLFRAYQATEKVKTKALILIEIASHPKVSRDSSIMFGEEALKLSVDSKLDSCTWASTQAIGEIYMYSMPRDIKMAIRYFADALSIAERINDKDMLLKSHASLGGTYWRIGMDAKSLEHRMKALELARLTGDRIEEARALNGLSISSHSQKDYVKALDYAQQAVSIYEVLNESKYIGQSYINLGTYHLELKNYDEAVKFYEMARLEFEKRQLNLDAALSGLGNVYIQQKEYKKARIYYSQWIQYYKKYGNEDHLYKPYISIGTSYLLEENFPEALFYFKSALPLIPNQTDPNSYLRNVYDGLAKAYEGIGDYKNGIQYRNLWIVQQDSLTERSNRDKLFKLSTQLEIENQNKSLALAKKDMQIYKLTSSILLIVIGIIILSSLVVIYLLVVRHRRRARHAETVLKNIEEKLTKSQETESLLINELDIRSRELMSFTLQMINKNEQLESIKMELDGLKKITSGDSQKKISTLLSSIHLSQRLDKDWENFRNYFDQVHRGFFDNLKSKYPSLSPTDYKISALVKMNLDVKQMASILDISPESTKVAKHRLKKKLNLEINQDLKHYLDTLN